MRGRRSVRPQQEYRDDLGRCLRIFNRCSPSPSFGALTLIFATQLKSDMDNRFAGLPEYTRPTGREKGSSWPVVASSRHFERL